MLGFSWAKPWKPTQVAYRFVVITQATLASALSSFGTEHVLKDNTHSGLQLQQLERRLHHQQGHEVREQRRGPILFPADSEHHNTNHTPTKGIMASIP